MEARHYCRLTQATRRRYLGRRPGLLACQDGPMSDEDLFASLSVRLRDAHRRVGSLQAEDAQKARVARRLLAISDASKHDLARASGRLDRLLADLDAGRFPSPED